ncbi:MAG: hypothetical protein ABIQ51_03885 [Mesorhizobium sp.]
MFRDFVAWGLRTILAMHAAAAVCIAAKKGTKTAAAGRVNFLAAAKTSVMLKHP